MKSAKRSFLAFLPKTFVFVLPLTLALTQVGKADTITDTTLDVNYTATSTFVAGPGNVYDVFLDVDPTSFSQGDGFLTAIEMQFKTGSDISSSVTLLAAPGGPSDWSAEIPGGINAGGCDAAGMASGSVCFQNGGSAGTTVPGGPYDFEFAVTMPGTDALTAASDIKADYNTEEDNSGKNLGITSQSITIQESTVPEPSYTLLLAGGILLVGIARMARAKLRA